MIGDEYFDSEELRRRVRILSVKSEYDFAKQHNLDRFNLNSFMHGRRAPSFKLLKVLGYERVIAYRRKT